MKICEKLDCLFKNNQDALEIEEMQEIFGDNYEELLIAKMYNDEDFDLVFEEEGTLYRCSIRFNYAFNFYHFIKLFHKNHFYKEFEREYYDFFYSRYHSGDKEKEKMKHIVLHKKFRIRKMFQNK